MPNPCRQRSFWARIKLSINIILFIRKIWSKHYLFDLRLIMKFSRFTSHYSIFNQLALFSERMFLNISSISILSNRFWRFYQKIFIQLRASELNFVEPRIGAFYNIEPIYPSFKSISKLFLSFSINFSISSLLLPALPGGAKRDIIYHLILLCQAEFYFFIRFFIQPGSSPHLPWEANRDII